MHIRKKSAAKKKLAAKKKRKRPSNTERMRKIAKDALEFTRGAKVTKTIHGRYIGHQARGTLYHVKSGETTKEFGVFGKHPNRKVAVKVGKVIRVIVYEKIAREIIIFLEKNGK